MEIYIDKGDKAQNKEAFDALVNQKEAMEKEIGASLDWDRLEQAQASRISISRSFIFEEPQSVREQVKAWGVDMMLKFIDAFQPRIRNLQPLSVPFETPDSNLAQIDFKFTLEVDVNSEEGISEGTLQNQIKETLRQIGAGVEDEDLE